MPTIDVKPLSRYTTLAKALAHHLVHPPSPRFEPFVIEDQIAQTKSLHVLVIWDEWEHLNREERRRVIMDAFKTANRLKGRTITVATGLTDREALRMGFLRYKLLMALKKSDPVTERDLAHAYEAAGGVLEVIGVSPVRHFPTQEAVEDGYRAAADVKPGPYWIIEREVAASEA